MVIIRLIRFLCGYVKFNAVGVYCERFLNLLHFHDIRIWDFRKKEITMTAFIKAKDYKKLKSHAKKTGVRIKIEKKFGLPFILRKHRKRFGFFIGLLVFLVILSIMSNFVLTVEVEGNETISSEKILGTLEKFGVKKGSIPSDSEFYFIEQKTLLEIPELSWIAINRNGSNVLINVKERTIAPPIIDSNIPCDIVAKESGFITKIDAFRGQATVKSGFGVIKGDILVSGTLTNSTGSILKVHSIAKIEAETEKTIITTALSKDNELKETGNVKKNNTLNLFGFDIPLYFRRNSFEQYNKTETFSTITIFNYTLPFSLKKEVFKEKSAIETEYSTDEMKEIAYKKLDQILLNELGDTKIIDKISEEKIVTNEESGIKEFILETTLKCKEDIGEEKKIE